MWRLFSHRHRPPSLGSLPLERLARTDRPPPGYGIAALPPLPEECSALTHAIRASIDCMDGMRDGDVNPLAAAIPDDPAARAAHLKAACYYLDASLVGCARIPAAAWRDAPVPEHEYAVVMLFEHTRPPQADEPGGEWLVDSQAHRAAVRVNEVAVVIAQYLRLLGFPARAHTRSATELDLARMVVAAGLGEAEAGSGLVNAAFLGREFGVAVVSTTLALAPDPWLARGASHGRGGLAGWLGWGGCRPGFDRPPYARREFHRGLWPMERIRHREEPSTTIDTANIPRLPKRHDMFFRAELGDLGPKAQREALNERMLAKSPFGHALLPVLGGRLSMQAGETAAEQAAGFADPEHNSKAVKALLYYLGADMVGICEIPEYAWYSHQLDGSEIQPYHRYAIVTLIDQGYETMEGASGDDWISGAQSMRAYLRAQLIGNISAAFLRSQGYSSRVHSVIDQDVLHIPLLMLAGLGELSRIGELVLNPFVGPRFKSGVITTDLPLAPDQPVDFGLQDFCAHCRKCARECPCEAIPFGDKILFNGYEIWKPDVEKCARYRITNSAGSMCGRCMKTCPWNLEGVLAEWPFLWAAMHLPFTRPWLARFDDWLGRGRINPVKKWWWDLEIDADGRYVPARRTNERQLEFRPRTDPAKQKLACYPADMAPPPAAGPTPPDRKAGLRRYREAPRPPAG